MNTSIQCPHGAKVTHPPSQVRVKIGQGFALTVADKGMVGGCPFTLPNGKPSPCMTVEWSAPALRIKLSGQAALLASSVGLCKSPEQAAQGPAIASPSPRVKGM
ncbi:hypothetical protein ACNOYE_00085 [Nannocystaceae bacterium ST9]